MPVGRRYKHVASRFQQWRTLPPDCKSWIERRDDDPSSADGANATGPQPSAASTPSPAANPAAKASASTASSAISATGRMGGDLPENVTEERLYRSRLYDLARERQKMIQESDYVRNQFIDHQVRKASSKSLSRLLQGINIEQYRNKSASGVEKLYQRSAHAKLMILATKRLNLSIDEIKKLSETELRQRLNMPTTSGQDETIDEPVSAPPPATAPLPPLSEQQQLSERPSTSRTQAATNGWPERQPSALRRGSRRPGFNAFAPSASLPEVGPSTTDRQSSSRRQSSSYRARGTGGPSILASSVDRRPRTASARRRVQSDPRCVQLINTLTPRYKPTPGKVPPQDVGAIIRANPSLFQPAREANPDKQQKIQQKHSAYHQRQKVANGRRPRDEALEILDRIVKARYYEAGNLATLI